VPLTGEEEHQHAEHSVSVAVDVSVTVGFGMPLAARNVTRRPAYAWGGGDCRDGAWPNRCTVRGGVVSAARNGDQPRENDDSRNDEDRYRSDGASALHGDGFRKCRTTVSTERSREI
jgi:hypothetical protein